MPIVAGKICLYKQRHSRKSLLRFVWLQQTRRRREQLEIDMRFEDQPVCAVFVLPIKGDEVGEVAASYSVEATWPQRLALLVKVDDADEAADSCVLPETSPQHIGR